MTLNQFTEVHSSQKPVKLCLSNFGNYKAVLLLLEHYGYCSQKPTHRVKRIVLGRGFFLGMMKLKYLPKLQ